MIAVDTNVLVRYLVEDDRAQTARAARSIEGAVGRDETIFVSDVVLCELARVLTASYRRPRTELAELLAQLLRARHLSFASPARLHRALEAFRAGAGDFADYLIREQARDAGCTSVATFDRALLADPGFRSP